MREVVTYERPRLAVRTPTDTATEAKGPTTRVPAAVLWNELWRAITNKHGGIDKRKVVSRARRAFLGYSLHPYWNDPRPGDWWDGPRVRKDLRTPYANPKLVPTVRGAFRSVSARKKTDAILLLEEEKVRRCRSLSQLKDFEEFGAASHEVDLLTSRVKDTFQIGLYLAKTGEWLTDGVKEDGIGDLLSSVRTPQIHPGWAPGAPDDLGRQAVAWAQRRSRQARGGMKGHRPRETSAATKRHSPLRESVLEFLDHCPKERSKYLKHSRKFYAGWKRWVSNSRSGALSMSYPTFLGIVRYLRAKTWWAAGEWPRNSVSLD